VFPLKLGDEMEICFVVLQCVPNVRNRVEIQNRMPMASMGLSLPGLGYVFDARKYFSEVARLFS
jgi:hypothetical protein